MTGTGGTTRAHQVYEVLRTSIVDLERPPGARLSENRVAADLGVSRTPVREALQRLNEERFVVRDERGSFVVAGVTHGDVDGLCDLLELVDSYLFGRAAAVAGPAAAELTAIAQRLRAAADGPDLDAWSTADGRFHELVNELAGNEWATQVARTTRSRLHRFWLNHEARRQRLRDCSDEHVELASALAEGDADRATRLVRGHVGHMRESLHGLLDAASPFLGGAGR
ncbi:GntR family transcriptional regulator [Pseudonocardia adelaidensis]|uniref:GntR family transcriptional regulator n=1 Tax=Pseudonocardia adelaidensis TaxID=648754 RepID=A0ABP9NN33_9PSEU